MISHPLRLSVCVAGTTGCLNGSSHPDGSDIGRNRSVSVDREDMMLELSVSSSSVSVVPISLLYMAESVSLTVSVISAILLTLGLAESQGLFTSFSGQFPSLDK